MMDTDDLFGRVEYMGRRDGMEDTSDVLFVENEGIFLIGVYDGHGGESCSKFVKEKLLKRIHQRLGEGESPKKAMEKAFLSVDQDYCNLAEKLELEDGSTATVCLLIGDEYWLAATGDSRAVIVNHSGTKALSVDHKPDRRDERQRITKAGGAVEFDHMNETHRVVYEDMGLAVTRAIGDYLFKPYVTAMPEITHGKLTEDSAFICMASDGLWDDVQNEDAGRVLLDEGEQDIHNAVRELVNIAYSLGSEDNITVCAVNLQRWIEIDREIQEAKREEILEREREALAKESRKSKKRSSTDDKKHASVSSTSSRKSKASKRVIPGLDEDGYLSELLLWKSPMRTGLWLLTGSLFFFLSYLAGYSMLTLFSYLLMMQIVITIFVVKATPVLKRLRLVGQDFDSTLFVLQGSLFSDEVVTRAADITHRTTASVFSKWNAVVQEGSATRILMSLRFISYFFSPLPLEIILFATFLGLFSLPATYHHNQDTLDKQYQKMVSQYQKLVRKMKS